MSITEEHPCCRDAPTVVPGSGGGDGSAIPDASRNHAPAMAMTSTDKNNVRRRT